MKLALSVTTAAVLLASACSGSGSPSADPTAATVQPTSAAPTIAPCVTGGAATFRWPTGIPADLPKPPSSAYLSATTSKDGVTIVRLSSTLSLQQSVLFVIKAVQSAGYTLGRGDAEPAEADAPFGKDDVRGLYKMIVRDTCSTDWLIATARVNLTGGSPLLPQHTPGPNASPLPFG